MEFKSFRQLENQLETIHKNKDFPSGLELVDNQLEKFETFSAQLYLWRVKFFMATSNVEKAIFTLADALSKGYWYASYLLVNEEIFEPLQSIKEFKNIVDISAKMEAVDQTNFLPQLIVRPKNGCGPQDVGCPLFYFLHDDNDQALNHLPYWHSLSNQGWIVGMPQPNNPSWVGAFHWKTDDARKELLKNITSLHLRYSIDVNQVVMGGYGSGGEFAFRLFLAGEIIGESFVLINPRESMFEDGKNWDLLIESSSLKNKHCVIVADKNSMNESFSKLNRMNEKLNQYGIESHIRSMDFGKEFYPESFSVEIPKLIKFVTQN
jgi:hypothetical protein